MALRYGPFSSGAGANVGQDFWIAMGRLWMATGVVRGEGNELAVFADSTGMQVKIPTGTAWVEGQLCISDALTTVAIATANSSNPRIDRVVLRKDDNANIFSFLTLTGTASASPTPPTLTQTSTVWDVPLAQVLVPASATTIAGGNVTDERPLCRNADIGAVQTFTNKTLTAPTILSFVNAQHNHGSAAAGGTVAAPRYVMLSPGTFLPAASNGATLAQSNDSFELQFADGADRVAVCRDAITVPPTYAGTPITFRCKGYTPSANQNVTIDVLAAVVQDGSSPYPALTTQVATVNATSSGTAGAQLTWTATWTSGLPTALADLQLALRRTASAAFDTSTDTLRIRKVLLDFGS